METSGRGSARESRSSPSCSSVLQSTSKDTSWETLKEAQTFLEKHDPQYKQWKEEAKEEEEGGVDL